MKKHEKLDYKKNTRKNRTNKKGEKRLGGFLKVRIRFLGFVSQTVFFLQKTKMDPVEYTTQRGKSKVQSFWFR